MRSDAPGLGLGWRRHVPPEWAAGWEPQPFALEGGETRVVCLGAGPPLLLLPSLPGWKETWLACASRLARRFRVVTFDLRACGRGGRAWARLLADLEAVADAFAPGAAGVVGHSLGGALAQRWALRRPERVAALVLSSSFARVRSPAGDRWARFVEQPLVLAAERWLPAPAALGLARRWAARGAWVYDPRCGDAVLDFVRFAIREVPLALAAERVGLALDHDLRDALPRLSCPTLIVRGERESLFVREAAAELALLVPGAETRVSPGVGHLHPLSGADWLCATLEEWLPPRLGS